MSMYIAYGSNINLWQMQYRCPTAKVVGNGMLEDFKLIFRLYATIEPSEGDRVPFTLWEIDEECEKSLDRYEGYPRLYHKKILDVNVDGKSYKAMVYVMNENVHSYQFPADQYLGIIVRGYLDMGHDLNYINKAFINTEEKIKLGGATYASNLYIE